MAVELSDEQEAAFAAMVDFYKNRRGFSFVLHGLAGTGKTTVLAKLARQFPHAMLCTLTGKAASVLRLKTELGATTIHAAFYTLKEKIKDKKGRDKLIFGEQHEEGALEGGLLLLDECSMVNETMARDILRAGVRIIASGDPGQLPPVEGKQFFKEPNFTLKTIHRQALESPIIRQAHAVRVGGNYSADGENFRVARHGELSADDKLSADIVLVWTNATRKAVNRHMRELRGLSMIPHPQPGEPVVCLRNAPEYGVFNGGIYILAEPFMEGDTTIVLEVEGSIVHIDDVNFEGVRSGLLHSVKARTWFDFGYCITVHKSQGSEWSNVILIDEYRRREERKEWLYTGITRAANKITIVR